MKILCEFYIYAYLDPRKPGLFSYDDGLVEFDYEPFYIGKGSNGRYCSIQGRSSYFLNKVSKIEKEMERKPIILKIIGGLTEEEAFEFEKEVVKMIGRRDKKGGCLLNLTDGGEGESGRIVSKDHKKKISESLKGFKHSEETKRKMSKSHMGKLIPRDIVEKRRLKQIGVPKSDEHKRKISKVHKGKVISKKQRKKHSEFMKQNNPFKGKKHSEETIAKMILSREGLIGRPHTEKSKEKIRKSKIGKPRSEETKCKISKTLKERQLKFQHTYNGVVYPVVSPTTMRNFV